MLTSSGATYKAVEFSGEFVKELSISERFTLCNMVIEAGGKSAMIEPDDKVKEKYKDKNIDWEIFKPDDDVEYLEIKEYDISQLEPQVACPHYVDNVKDLRLVEGVKIDQAFLGGCTNGRLDDLEIAADLLKNKKIHKDVRLLIVPASVNIYKEAIRRGYIETFIEAGAIINHPGCSTCWGSSIGSLTAGQVMITSANRNFKGRAGSAQSEIYLGSPATVIASAINGKLTNPTKEM